MPQIIVKHSESPALDIPALLRDLHETLCAHETIVKTDVKARAIPLSYVIVGDETQPDSMIHITLLMKLGRPTDLKSAMSKALHDTARRHADAAKIYAVSVETTELDIETYHSSYKS